MLRCDAVEQGKNVSHAERPDPIPALIISRPMSSCNCFRDGCSQKFGSQRALSQHIRRRHDANPGTSLLTQIVSDHQDRKRKRGEREEAERAEKRRELEVIQEELVPPEPVVPLPSHITGTNAELTIE